MIKKKGLKRKKLQIVTYTILLHCIFAEKKLKTIDSLKPNIPFNDRFSLSRKKWHNFQHKISSNQKYQSKQF